MQLTLKDVMEMEVMSTARVRTGKNRLEQQPVESISVIGRRVHFFTEQNHWCPYRL